MKPIRALLAPLTLALALVACGGSDDTKNAAQPAPTGQAAGGDAAADENVETIDESSLQEAARIELKQYTVAYIGSGSMGGGTLTAGGKTYPFKIAGLGVGGIGASALDATGTVYNLPNLEAFAGTYGNARLGMTAGESGGGRLWLKNTDGVVLKLESQMRGLALTGGVDGILIQWKDGRPTAMDNVRDGTTKAVGGTIEAGADVIGGGIDAVKRPFQ